MEAIMTEDAASTSTLVESTHSKAKPGTKILRGFNRDGHEWVGNIYVPKRRKTLNAELTLKDGKLAIEVSAGLRTKSVVWTRAR
jgi:uncharacterized protein (DUF2147 family)